MKVTILIPVFNEENTIIEILNRVNSEKRDDTEIEIEQEPARAFIFDPGVELADIVDAINGVGGSPADLVAILEALREAGSLRAEIIVI